MSSTADYGGGIFAHGGGVVLVLTSPIVSTVAASGDRLAAQDTVATLHNSAVLRTTASSGDGGCIPNSGSLSMFIG